MKRLISLLVIVVLGISYPVWRTLNKQTLKEAEKKIIIKPALKKVGSARAATVKSISSRNLSVPYIESVFRKSGKTVNEMVPNFKRHAICSEQLPKSLIGKANTKQFLHGVAMLRATYLNNPIQLIKKLKAKNKQLLKRDNIIFKANKTEILDVEAKMLLATKEGDRNGALFYLKELRRLTKDINFIQTPAGKPFIRYNEDQILEKQIGDINNPLASNQGRIFGFEWHHSHIEDQIDLVPKDIHRFNKHTGGNVMWNCGVR